MFYKGFLISAFTATILGSANPTTAPATPVKDTVRSPETSDNPLNMLQARDSCDCAGSSTCGGMEVKYCDIAVNSELIRDNDYNYGAGWGVKLQTPRFNRLLKPHRSGRPWDGDCKAWSVYLDCKIFIASPLHCSRTGNEMWWDYQDIRKAGFGPSTGATVVRLPLTT